jgi:antibiotic biosynthesis monooxygenase (ABM) superfamily enzyme
MKQTRPAKPKKWKIAVVVWLAIYPVITLLQIVFGNQLSKISWLPLRTLVVTAVVIPIMVYIMEPLMKRIFAHWLNK